MQTLSRLNRAYPQKADTFVLDFADNAEAVKAAFQEYCRATIQDGETDPNKLYDIKAELDAQQVYSTQQVDDLVALYLSGADRDKLDPVLDVCVAEYASKLGEDDQVKFKGKAKAFVRSYGFLSAILPHGHPAWEKLSIFLSFLIPKLPAPKEEDLSKGVLEAIDMDSYRSQAQAAMKMALPEGTARREVHRTADRRVGVCNVPCRVSGEEGKQQVHHQRCRAGAATGRRDHTEASGLAPTSRACPFQFSEHLK